MSSVFLLASTDSTDPFAYLTVPYMIHNDHLQFTITCHERTPGKEFIANLGKAADAIMDMMEGAGESKL